jgi:hypothetical protein
MNQAARVAKEHWRKALAVVAILAILGILFWPGGVTAPADNQEELRAPHAAPAKAKHATVQSRMFFVGDIYWGRYINKKAQASTLKEAYPFSRLNEFGRSSYDAWVGNLECPSVPGVNQPYNLEVQKLLFNCPSDYLPEFAKWFTLVSLANNHTSNQGGQKGLDATRQALDSQHIQYFGHYDPEVMDDTCEVAAVPARSGGKAVSLPMAFCGYHGLAGAPAEASLVLMGEYSKYMPVVAYVHMGAEYTAAVDKTRQNLYRSMVDHGADMVIGAHPHWVQPAEVYKGRLIAYSLGNFMFDQEPGETSRGAAITLELKAEVTADTLGEWSKIGGTCASFKDGCLAEFQRQQLARSPFTFDYMAQSVDMSGYLTHPGNDALDRVVLERLGWQSVQEQLKSGQ